MYIRQNCIYICTYDRTGASDGGIYIYVHTSELYIYVHTTELEPVTGGYNLGILTDYFLYREGIHRIE